MTHHLIHFRPATERPRVAAIGFFDGVHRGHRFLLDEVVATARAQGAEALVVTFERHPRSVLQSDFCPQLLTTNAEKLARLDAAGLDACALLHFTPQMAALTAAEFMRFLHDTLRVETLIMGYDHHFGSDRLNFDDYVARGSDTGISVRRATAYATEEFTVSSSTVRRLLEGGQVERATQCLGYAYALEGRVVTGQKLGRRLGYPTANIIPADGDKLVPGRGVYAASVDTDGQRYAAMVNIGFRPTVDDGRGATIEAHLFNYNGDLYGHLLTLHFCHRLRDEQHFDSLDDLRRQLATDAHRAQALLSADTSQIL